MTKAHSRKRTHATWLSFLSAHRLKATLTSAVAAFSLLVGTGFIDASVVPPWAKTMLTQVGVTLPAQAPKPAVTAASGTTMATCFTPGEDCTGLIVNAIAGAKSEVLVQAYGFTSADIVAAIAAAKERGVAVRVILDKSNESDKYTGATYLEHHGIAPLIDDKVAIAHNKVIVIDGTTVITGSFNFTDAAEKKNAENVLVVSGDTALAATYSSNWKKRAEQSRPYSGANVPSL